MPPMPTSTALADLLVGFGANLQPGQILGVTAYLGMEDAARAVARAAYRRGAKYVDVFWWDQLVKRARLELAAEDTLDYVPPWIEQRMDWLSDEHAARVSLTGHERRGLRRRSIRREWAATCCPTSRPCRAIINAAHDELDGRAVPEPRLGAACAPGARAGGGARQALGRGRPRPPARHGDPVEAWQERMETIVASADRLTERRFDALHLQGPGTDLTIGLMPSSKWLGAHFTTAEGLTHYPNLPTEEVFTTPDPERVDGHVSATMPLELYGSYMNGIRIEFERGRAVKADADEGADALRATIAKDDGASRLGEIALVDKEGRIGPLGTVFYDTLLDENAASHIALGNAYTFPVEDEAERERVNKSDIHVDFMIGSNEVDVDGITRDGDRVPVLRGGAWQIWISRARCPAESDRDRSRTGSVPGLPLREESRESRSDARRPLSAFVDTGELGVISEAARRPRSGHARASRRPRVAYEALEERLAQTSAAERNRVDGAKRAAPTVSASAQVTDCYCARLGGLADGDRVEPLADLRVEPPRSSSRGSAATLSSPKTRSKSGVVR